MASHAQKYFIRLNSLNKKDKRRSSIHDINSIGPVPAPITGQKEGGGGGGERDLPPLPDMDMDGDLDGVEVDDLLLFDGPGGGMGGVQGGLVA